VSERVENIIRARYLVARLGEQEPSLWWRSQATTEVSARWLRRLFPRTSPRAGLEIVTRAARTVHDSHLGGTGVYHLFRLPRSFEMAINEQLVEEKPDLSELTALAKTEALEMLVRLAGAEPQTVATGPISCGRVGGLQRGRGLQRVCAAYAAAFQSNTSAFPYQQPDEP